MDYHVKWLLEETLKETQSLARKVDEMLASHARTIGATQTTLAAVEKLNAVVRRQNDHGERLRALEKHSIPPPRNRENSSINELTPEIMATLMAAREAQESERRRASWAYRKRWTVTASIAAIIVSAIIGACAHSFLPVLKP